MLVGDNCDVNVHMRHLRPLFDPAAWYLHDTTLAAVTGVNNVCEGDGTSSSGRLVVKIDLCGN